MTDPVNAWLDTLSEEDRVNAEKKLREMGDIIVLGEQLHEMGCTSEQIAKAVIQYRKDREYLDSIADALRKNGQQMPYRI